MQPAKRNHPFTNSSAPSASSRPQKSYQKNKGIEKPNRNREDLRLNKSTGALRADKKSLKHRGSQLFDQAEVQKAFGVHNSSTIDYSQCQFSLKLLGCLNGQEAETSKFKSIWREKGQQQVDYALFQQIYHKLFSKQHQQTTRELFSLVSQKSPTIELSNLKEMAETVGWKGNVQQIFHQTGTKNISYEEFNRILNIHLALF